MTPKQWVFYWFLIILMFASVFFTYYAFKNRKAVWFKIMLLIIAVIMCSICMLYTYVLIEMFFNAPEEMTTAYLIYQ